jgi:hypothetical protein
LKTRISAKEAIPMDTQIEFHVRGWHSDRRKLQGHLRVS